MCEKLRHIVHVIDLVLQRIFQGIYPAFSLADESIFSSRVLYRSVKVRSKYSNTVLSPLQVTPREWRMDFRIIRRTRRISRRWCAPNADERTKWNATWRHTWSSSAAARETSNVTCVRLSTRRTSVYVVIFCSDTISICRRSSRYLNASLPNNHNATIIGPAFLVDELQWLMIYLWFLRILVQRTLPNDVIANNRWIKKFRKLIYMQVDIYVIIK